MDHAGLARRLARGGFLSPRAEADRLIEAAGDDVDLLTRLVERRENGEPLAWIVGYSDFCGLRVAVAEGVYVPRPQTELLAVQAIARLPADGRAVDVCTGSGAIAMAMSKARDRANILATDIDPVAVACALCNGVDAQVGDLLNSVPEPWRGTVDVITAVVPYVPTGDLAFLQRDTFRFENQLAYDGGPGGVDLLLRMVAESSAYLKPGGSLICELGGEQLDAIRPELVHEFKDVTEFRDEEDDLRGFVAVLAGS